MNQVSWIQLKRKSELKITKIKRKKITIDSIRVRHAKLASDSFFAKHHTYSTPDPLKDVHDEIR